MINDSISNGDLNMRKKKMLFALAGFACLSIALTSCEDFLNRVKNPNGNTTETTDTGDDNNPTGDNTPTGEDTPSTGDDTPTGGDTPSTGDDTKPGEDTPTEDTSKLLLTIKRDTVPNVVSNVETGIYPLVSSEESINGVDFIFSEDVGVSTNYKDYSPLQIRAKSKAYLVLFLEIVSHAKLVQGIELNLQLLQEKKESCINVKFDPGVFKIDRRGYEFIENVDSLREQCESEKELIKSLSKCTTDAVDFIIDRYKDYDDNFHGDDIIIVKSVQA